MYKEYQRRYNTLVIKRQTQVVTMNTYSFLHHGTKISYNTWLIEPLETPRTVLFLGAAQVGILGEWITRHCPPGTVVVQGLPHWLVDDEDITAFAITYSTEALKEILTRYHVETIDIIAESQAATSVIKLFSNPEFESRLGSLVLVQPLGLNQAIFQAASDPFSLFLRRTFHNAKHQSLQLFEWMFYHNARQISKHLSLRDPLFRKHYTTGVMQNIAPELKILYDDRRHRTAIICGEKDMLFPPSEIKATLRKYTIGTPILVIPKVPHSPLVTKHGLKLLKAAFTTLERP